MNCHIEPTAGVIRVFADGHGYGDPYTFAASLRWIDRETAEVLAALRAPTPSEWRAMRQAARQMRLKALVYLRRYPDGRSREVRIDV